MEFFNNQRDILDLEAENGWIKYLDRSPKPSTNEQPSATPTVPAIETTVSADTPTPDILNPDIPNADIPMAGGSTPPNPTPTSTPSQTIRPSGSTPFNQNARLNLPSTQPPPISLETGATGKGNNKVKNRTQNNALTKKQQKEKKQKEENMKRLGIQTKMGTAYRNITIG